MPLVQRPYFIFLKTIFYYLHPFKSTTFKLSTLGITKWIPEKGTYRKIFSEGHRNKMNPPFWKRDPGNNTTSTWLEKGSALYILPLINFLKTSIIMSKWYKQWGSFVLLQDLTHFRKKLVHQFESQLKTSIFCVFGEYISGMRNGYPSTLLYWLC